MSDAPYISLDLDRWFATYEDDEGMPVDRLLPTAKTEDDARYIAAALTEYDPSEIERRDDE